MDDPEFRFQWSADRFGALAGGSVGNLGLRISELSPRIYRSDRGHGFLSFLQYANVALALEWIFASTPFDLNHAMCATIDRIV